MNFFNKKKSAENCDGYLYITYYCHGPSYGSRILRLIVFIDK